MHHRTHQGIDFVRRVVLTLQCITQRLRFRLCVKNIQYLSGRVVVVFVLLNYSSVYCLTAADFCLKRQCLLLVLVCGAVVLSL